MSKLATLVALALVGAAVAVIPASSAGASDEAFAARASGEPTARVNAPACATHIVVDDSGNGSSVCVAGHGDVTIMLTAAAGSSWSQPAATGAILGPPLGVPTPHGLVGWSLRADATGRAEITTSGPNVVYRVGVTVR